MTPTEISANLRRQAFDFPPFGAKAPANTPYGFIAEFLQGQTMVTMACFITGDVSIYFSTGGGIIGGAGKAELASLARETVAALTPLVAQLEISEARDPPGEGEYCFYILTPGGRRVCRIHMSDTARADGPEVKLIRMSGALLTAIRATSSS